MPNLTAFSAACWAAIWPANGVLLRLPLKPLVPALAQQSVSPLVSVIVIDRVVERRLDVGDAHGHVATDFASFCLGHG